MTDMDETHESGIWIESQHLWSQVDSE